MSKHFPTVVWGLRPIHRGTESNGYVRTMLNGRIHIDYRREDYGSVAFTLSRQDAKMLAKRINECLEATR